MSIFNLGFLLKKQKKFNINKYAKQCTNTNTDFDLLMDKKELLIKRKLKKLKFTSKKVNLEINEANDRDNNNNVILITIGTVKIENNEQIQ